MPGTLARKAARPRARLGLTPLIDVVFILLVFFMLASRFTDWRAIELTTAGASGTAASYEGAMLVRVEAGAVLFGGRAIGLDRLEARLAERLAGVPDQRVLVQTAPGVATQRLVDVLDRLDAAGVRDLALVPAGAPPSSGGG
ncbi:MAG: ExbD/TolR family protein [Paracoccaceae bacterium]